jgi:protein SCO1/2
MRAYLNKFDPEFIGLTGDEVTLRQMGAEYGLMFQQDTSTVDQAHVEEDQPEEGLDDENYFVQHTSPSFLIDQNGYLRMVFFYNTEPATMADNIREVLQG